MLPIKITHRAAAKVPLNKWLIAWYLLCSSEKGFSASQLHGRSAWGATAAWFMMHRMRYALSDPAFSKKLGGPGGSGVVEADETYIGGKK